MKSLLELLIYNHSKSKNLLKKFTSNNFIRCIAHAINLIVKSILKSLKTCSMEEAFMLLDTYTCQNVGVVSSIMKIRDLSIYIKESPQRQENWLQLISKEQPKKNSCNMMLMTEVIQHIT
jgi:hypothetical protein